MRLLLDTHTALWVLAQDEQLSQPAVDAIGEPSSHVLLSAVVVWEIAIKRALGKLDVPPRYLEQLLDYAFVPLPITLAHAAAVESLPRHHGDPFDRLLIAQARAEGATVVTDDPRIRLYDVSVLW